MLAEVFSFTVFGPPVPWSRAIPLGFGRAAKSQEQRKYQRLVATIALLRRPPDWKLKGRYRMGFRFYAQHELSDVDNYVKNIKDALQSVAFKNDKMVCGYDECERLLDRDNPRSEVTVRRVA